MSEWLKEPASKTGLRQRNGGSNPSLTAKTRSSRPRKRSAFSCAEASCAPHMRASSAEKRERRRRTRLRRSLCKGPSARGWDVERKREILSHRKDKEQPAARAVGFFVRRGELCPAHASIKRGKARAPQAHKAATQSLQGPPRREDGTSKAAGIFAQPPFIL